jgi:hypothetical protein
MKKIISTLSALVLAVMLSAPAAAVEKGTASVHLGLGTVFFQKALSPDFPIRSISDQTSFLIEAGFEYFIMDNLSLEAGLRPDAILSPTFSWNNNGFYIGARYYFMQRFYARLAFPVYLVQPGNRIVLLIAGGAELDISKQVKLFAELGLPMTILDPATNFELGLSLTVGPKVYF